ncbi:MAG: alpha/beta hydrolase, partial [Oscillospiraceae bacterium]|nr:alpha/beta hydrolase [Oscillospiraceae bacterium]
FGSGEKKLIVLPGLSDGLATVKGKAWILSLPYRRFDGYTVYMFSRKNKMPEGYTIREMATDQVRTMRELGIEKVSVLGVSQGGKIAQYMAADHPEAVDRLILAVTAPYANDTVTGAVSGWIDMAKRDDHMSLWTDTAEKTYSDSYLKKNRWVFPITAKLAKPHSYERFFRNAYAILGYDARSALPSITAPTLILAGDHDLTVGNDAPYELHEMIDGSTMHIYKGLGHGAYEEAKDFYDRVYAFCEGR